MEKQLVQMLPHMCLEPLSHLPAVMFCVKDLWLSGFIDGDKWQDPVTVFQITRYLQWLMHLGNSWWLHVWCNKENNEYLTPTVTGSCSPRRSWPIYYTPRDFAQCTHHPKNTKWRNICHGVPFFIEVPEMWRVTVNSCWSWSTEFSLKCTTYLLLCSTAVDILWRNPSCE